MADAFHEVVYRAVADFSQVVREAARTRAELAALNADIEKFNRGAGGGNRNAGAGNVDRDIRSATSALREQNVEFDKNRALLDKHTASLRAAGKEFDAFTDKYTQRGFDGLGQRALQNLNTVAGKMRETVDQHHRELARLTEGRDFKFNDAPGRVTQPGLFSRDEAKGVRELDAYTRRVDEFTAALDRNTEAGERNRSMSESVAENTRNLAVQFSNARDTTDPGTDVGADTERQPGLPTPARAAESETQRNQRLSNTQRRSTRRRLDSARVAGAEESNRSTALSNQIQRAAARRVNADAAAQAELDLRTAERSVTEQLSNLRKANALDRQQAEARGNADVAAIEQQTENDRLKSEQQTSNLRIDTAAKIAALKKKAAAEVAKIEAQTAEQAARTRSREATDAEALRNQELSNRDNRGQRRRTFDAALESEAQRTAEELRDARLSGGIRRRTQRGVGRSQVAREEARAAREEQRTAQEAQSGAESLRNTRISNTIDRRTQRGVGRERVAREEERTAQAVERTNQARAQSEVLTARALAAEEKLSEATHRTAVAQERVNRAVHETATAHARSRREAELAQTAAANTLTAEERTNRAVHETAIARSRAATAAENAEQAAARTLIAEERVNQAVHGTEVARNRSLISQEHLEQVSARTLIHEEGLRRATIQTETAQHSSAAARERAEQAAGRTLLVEENLTRSTLQTAQADARRLRAVTEIATAHERLAQAQERTRNQADTNAGRELLLQERLLSASRRRGEAEERTATRTRRERATFGGAVGELRDRLRPYAARIVERGSIDRDISALTRLRNAFRDVRAARREASGEGPGGGGGGFLSTLAGAAGNFGSNIAESLGKAIPKLLTMRGLIVALIASLGPVVAALGALGAGALGAGNALVAMAGSVAALPGLLAAAVGGIGALLVAFKPVAAVFTAYQAAQKAANKASNKASADNVDVLKKEKEAQQDLNDARREALRNLQDLEIAVNRAGLDEEGARLNLRRAQADYRKALADPDSTLLDREEALHRVKTSENDLADVLRRNKRNVEDLSAAQQKGVEGSKAVQTALDALASAHRNAAAGSSAAAAANAELERTLGALGPNARKVAVAILGQAGAWKELQKYVGERLFGPVVGQLGKLPVLLGVVKTFLGESAAAVGDLIAKGVAMVSSGPWTADFATISRNNGILIRTLGDAALSVADAFRQITVAAAPFTQYLAEAIRRVADNFDRFATAGRRSGSIAAFLDITKERLGQFAKILGNVFSLFKSIFFASSDFTGDFLNGIINVTARWAAFGKTTEQTGSKFKKYLEDSKPLLRDIATFLGALASAFAQIAADPRNIAEAKGILTALSTTVLPALVRLFSELSRSGTVASVVQALGSLLDAVSAFLEAGGTTALQGFFGSLAFFIEHVVNPVLTFKPIAGILGAIAIGLGAVAAASVISRFSGLFLLIGALKFLLLNRGMKFTALLATAFGLNKPTGTAVSGTKAASDLTSGKVVGTYTGQLNTIIGLLERIAACSCADAAEDAGPDVPLIAKTKGKVPKKVPVSLLKGAEEGGEVAAKSSRLGRFFGPIAEALGLGALAKSASSGIGRLFGRGAAGAATAGAVAKTGLGLDLLTIPGLLLSLAADSGALGKKGSAGKQAGQAGGAILTGAGIGATIGSIIPGIGTAIGAVVGALIGGAYSLIRDKGLRKRVSDGWDAVYEGFMRNVGSPIADFFRHLGSNISKYLGLFFSGIGSAIISYKQKFIDSTIYQKLIRPVLAIVIGLNNAMFDFFGGIASSVRRGRRIVGRFANDYVVQPVLSVFRRLRSGITAIRLLVSGWVEEHLLRPLRGLYRYLDTITFGLRNVIRKFVEDHLLKPILRLFSIISGFVYGFFLQPLRAMFAQTGTYIGGLYGSLQGYIAEHISKPLYAFFAYLGKILVNLPTIAERLLEKAPIIGPYIAKAYRDLGVGTSVTGGGKRLQSGGLVEGTYDGRADTVQGWLTAGEWITRKRVVDKPMAKQLLGDLNNDRLDPAAFYAALGGAAMNVTPSASMTRTAVRPQVLTVSTVNNTGKGGMSVGDITINNPVRERSDRSLRRTLQTAAYLHNR